MGLEWATAEALGGLFSDNFDANGFVKPDGVPVLAKGTFAVVFKVPLLHPQVDECMLSSPLPSPASLAPAPLTACDHGAAACRESDSVLHAMPGSM